MRSLPLFNNPPAAILQGGALSGAFHPNGGRLEDMTITTDFFRRRRAACRRPTEPLCSAWRASIPFPGFSAGIGA
ncbi:hypothetical protein PQR14_01220 [Paraburkholderia bryophila]|uniref:hypothetical protein n=1 Tax=Burkholderiaceae TaxID=119060 RepID=UPI0012E003A0|nr:MULTISPECIES: hypothetical protein [Burkholderiaceae]